MDHCYRCHASLNPLVALPFGERLDMEADYRNNFPDTYKEEDRVRVCDTCYTEMKDDQPPQEWEVLRS